MRLWMLFALACGSAACPADAAQAQAPVDYSMSSSWLCLPGRSDACSAPLTSTVVAPAGGALSKRSYAPDPTAPIDCFYVYPTVSREPTANADMALGPEEQHAAMEQFARFGAKCRTFAPLYRQMTIAGMDHTAPGADDELAYRDVLGAWRLYLARHNDGRGFVLVGHSQGASLLARLIAEEIDGKPAQQRLVSAILTGGRIQVPTGREAGGTFRHIPLCRRAEQVGCLIAYSSYLAADAPGPGSIFAAAAGPGFATACVSPAALRAIDTLDAELPTVGDVAKLLGTFFVENPGLVSGACTSSGNRTFLAVSIKPAGFGAKRLAAALAELDARRPGWGLHALDMNLALGDLVEIVGRQGQAWRSARR